MNAYKLVWDDFCSWYLEMVNPVFGEPMSETTMQTVKNKFEKVLALIHPFMPFISEELHHDLHEGKPEKALIVSEYPKAKEISVDIKDNALVLISEIRNIRNNKGLSPKLGFDLIVNTSDVDAYKALEGIISKLANINLISYNEAKPEKCLSALAGKDELFIPFEEAIDEAAEQKKVEEEIAYLKGFLNSVDAKLSNEKFVANAKPDVIEKERQKKADAEEKIKKLGGA